MLFVIPNCLVRVKNAKGMLIHLAVIYSNFGKKKKTVYKICLWNVTSSVNNYELPTVSPSFFVDMHIKMKLSTASNSFEETTKKPIYAPQGEELFFFLHNVTSVEQIIFPEGEDFDYRDCQTR